MWSPYCEAGHKFECFKTFCHNLITDTLFQDWRWLLNFMAIYCHSHVEQFLYSWRQIKYLMSLNSSIWQKVCCWVLDVITFQYAFFSSVTVKWGDFEPAGWLCATYPFWDAGVYSSVFVIHMCHSLYYVAGVNFPLLTQGKDISYTSISCNFTLKKAIRTVMFEGPSKLSPEWLGPNF